MIFFSKLSAFVSFLIHVCVSIDMCVRIIFSFVSMFAHGQPGHTKCWRGRKYAQESYGRFWFGQSDHCRPVDEEIQCPKAGDQKGV